MHKDAWKQQGLGLKDSKREHGFFPPKGGWVFGKLHNDHSNHVRGCRLPGPYTVR